MVNALLLSAISANDDLPSLVPCCAEVSLLIVCTCSGWHLLLDVASLGIAGLSASH